MVHMIDFVVAAAVLVTGLGVAIWGSRVAVRHAAVLSAGSRIPPFVIGLTLIAIGTDLPEIANSVVASLAGHGDLVAGNAVGSTMAQATLILGAVPFFAGRFDIDRRSVLAVGVAIVAALAIGTLALADGILSRMDGLVLVITWIAAFAAVWRFLPRTGEPSLPLDRGIPIRLAKTVGGLVVVGFGAASAVRGMIDLASMLTISEYVVSFFGSSLGTSLPELVVAVTAVRNGETELAMGDVFGASLSDATLSLGLGPLIAPVAVSGVTVSGSVVAILVMVAVIAVLCVRKRHDRLSGLLLIGSYAALFPLLLTA